jgi:altronate hydrolase
MLALQCGGSDGYSGITANPALGAAVDILVEHGGTAILSETPEIYGAEHLLTRRAATREVGEKLVGIIKWWEDYTERVTDGDEQQSLARQQGGRAHHHPGEVAGCGGQGRHQDAPAVYHYAEPVTAKGFVYMDTPGYDPVAATGQVAGGSNVLCFTTGRGSAYGCKPTPSIKLATNTVDLREDDRRHGHQLRRRARRRLVGAQGRGDLRDAPEDRLGRAEQVRAARLWRCRIRALADRRDDVIFCCAG